MKLRILVVAIVLLLLLVSAALASTVSPSTDVSLWVQNAETCTIKYVCKPSAKSVQKPRKIVTRKAKKPRQSRVASKPAIAKTTNIADRSQLFSDPGYRQFIDPTGTGTPNLYDRYPTPAESFESQIRNNNLSRNDLPCACRGNDPFGHYSNHYLGSYYRIIDVYVERIIDPTDTTSHSSSSHITTVHVPEPSPLILLCAGLLALGTVRLRQRT